MTLRTMQTISSDAPAHTAGQPVLELEDGVLLQEHGLPALARKALSKSETTQTAAAEHLGVSRPALSMALSDRVKRGRNLCIRIIERFSEFILEGPLFRVRRASKQDSA